MPSRRSVPALLVVLAVLAGCGEPADEAPAPDGAALADSPTAEIAEPAIEFTAVDLPPGFPTDFPIAPASTIVDATMTDDEGGAYSEIEIVSQAEPAASYQWYRRALTDAGWQISSEGQTDETRTLHATQGESYVDLTVMPHPETPASWVRVTATILKVGA